MDLRIHDQRERCRPIRDPPCVPDPATVSRIHEGVRDRPGTGIGDIAAGCFMPLFTILSIDGGGIRGIIPAMVLAEIERRTGRRIAEMFDLIAGTSTGGILALGLTVPEEQNRNRPKYEASQLVSFYEEDGKEIFHSFWQDVVSLHGLMEERYPSEPIEGVLRKYLGEETKLSQALTEILITSYEIETCRPYFFTRRKARAKRGERFDPRMWEVARATTAAPTYFAPFQIKRSKRSHLPPLTLIDAGVFVNNPTLCAYMEAVACTGPRTPLRPPTGSPERRSRASDPWRLDPGLASTQTAPITWSCRSEPVSSMRRSGTRMPRTGEHFAGLGHSSTSPMTAAATRSTGR